jgi:hypothetical protein
MDTKLVRSVAKGLRYRSLQRLIGRTVEVENIDSIEEAVHLALGPDFPAESRLVGPELHFREGAIAKYGILDLRFTASAAMLTDEVSTGVPLLRQLNYLPDGQAENTCWIDHDPTCLEMLQEDICSGQTWLRLFLEGGRPGDEARVKDSDGHVSFRVPDSYLPRPFRIVDSCVTNAAGVWLWKHFYL